VTGAALDSFGPSLMPRSSMHQGIAGGLAVISARAIGQSVDRVVRIVAPETAPLGLPSPVAAPPWAGSRRPKTKPPPEPRSAVPGS
jgi:hypothetical protein